MPPANSAHPPSLPRVRDLAITVSLLGLPTSGSLPDFPARDYSGLSLRLPHANPL